MALANSKPAQTVRNLWHLFIAVPILAAAAVVSAIHDAIVDNGLLGEFSAGERAAMLEVKNALLALAALPGITGAAAKYIPSYKGNAITIAGVNDG